ncbi:MAG: DUF2062 domain-containing protein [Pseudomonadota bacterium]
MIFKRRERPSIFYRLREFIYPRKGFWRGFGYLGQRIRRLPDSPNRIALGFACGAMASFTPLFGLHFLVAVALAWALNGNMLASAFGTAVGNPVTFPLIATLSLQTGWWLLGNEGNLSPDLSFGWLVDNIDVIFLPYAVGGLLPGVVCGVVCYAAMAPLIDAYQARRRRRIQAGAELRRTRAEREQDAYAIHDAKEGDNA